MHRPQDEAHEQCGVELEYNDKEAEGRWRFEMRERLNEVRRSSSSWERRQDPYAQLLDINVRAYETICSIENWTIDDATYRSWGKILPEIVANREAPHPVGRRVLLKTLKEAANRYRKLAAAAKQRAQRYEA